MGALIDGKLLDLIQTAGIVLGLVLNVAALREEVRGRRVSTLVSLTEQHRQIWSEFLHRTELRRVREHDADLRERPATLDEEMFVKFVITHLQSAFRASKLDEVADIGNIQADANRFFSLPIPGAVWNKVKAVHSEDFVRFIDSPSSKNT